MAEMCCVKWKKNTKTGNVVLVMTKNNRQMKRGKCVVYGTTKTQFVSSEQW